MTVPFSGSDVSGAVQERFLYDPYGTATVLSSTWNGATDNYEWTPRFTGREYDIATGLYYIRARYYHSLLGTFDTRDPIRYLGGSNLYAGFSSNPGGRLDPTGMCDPWVPNGPTKPELKTKLFTGSEDIPNPPPQSYLLRFLTEGQGIGSTTVRETYDYQVLYKQEIELEVSVAGEPIAPGVDEGTLFTWHGEDVHYDFLTHKAAKQNQGKLVAVACRKWFLWVEPCRCCENGYTGKFDYENRSVDYAGKNGAWVYGTLIQNQLAGFGVSCNAYPTGAAPPAATSICSNGSSVTAGVDYA